MENQQKEFQKIKAFQNLEQKFAFIGIGPNLATQTYPLNIKIFMGILLLGSAIISTLVYATKEAKTLAEYTQSLFVCSILILIMFMLLTIILNVKTFYEYIIDLNAVINTSK